MSNGEGGDQLLLPTSWAYWAAGVQRNCSTWCACLPTSCPQKSHCNPRILGSILAKPGAASTLTCLHDTDCHGFALAQWPTLLGYHSSPVIKGPSCHLSPVGHRRIRQWAIRQDVKPIPGASKNPQLTPIRQREQLSPWTWTQQLMEGGKKWKLLVGKFNFSDKNSTIWSNCWHLNSSACSTHLNIYKTEMLKLMFSYYTSVYNCPMIVHN